jgi:formylglycine-generating enzyme required for sulfatase activity
MKQFIAVVLTSGLFFLLLSYIKPGNLTNAKQIERQFAYINEKMLVGKYEVSNLEYRKFLSYLIQEKQEGLYKNCLLDTAKWDTSTADKTMREKYHVLKTFDGYPLVTVSYESANEYCKWLTNRYNADQGRKFRKVVFRLPTEQEWTEAASGGFKQRMYPWNNFYLRNNKGEYLCNFFHLGDQAITYDQQTKSYKIAEAFIDYNKRAMPLSPVDAFSPSPAGLYNVSGNAAEMVAEKGLAKGGSYNEPGYDVRIGSKKYYNTASPEIGFRVMMEILEK